MQKSNYFSGLNGTEFLEDCKRQFVAMLFGQPASLLYGTEQWKWKKCSKTMRQSSHPGLSSCQAPLPPGKKYITVRYLNNQLLFFVVDIKGKCYEVIEDACKHLGLQDPELFSLAILQDGEYIFIDPSLKISKYADRNWKINENGVGSDGLPLLILHMRVKHYVDCHLLISEKVARHHYYIQLRENVKSYCQAVNEEKIFLLAALALQADLGNYSSEKHVDHYFEIKSYFPAWIVSKYGEDYIIQNIPALHKDNAGLSRGEAQVSYIKEASDDTAPHNLHFYKMKRKKGKLWNTVWLGIKDSGIHLYEENESEFKMKNLLSTFLWCDIAKLYFEKKKFEIESEGYQDHRRFTYYVDSEVLTKHLLWLCRAVHHFHMSNQLRVQDLKKLELEGGKTYRESYIYSDEIDLAWERSQNTLLENKLTDNHNLKLNGELKNYSEEKTFKSFSRKESFAQHTDKHGNVIDVPLSVLQHHSMEALPLTNGCLFSSDIKYKSQSISCFSDRSLAPCSVFLHSNIPSHMWASTQHSSLSTTPTSTLLSRSSCASCTDSACSSLSLTSGSTVKANPSSKICKKGVSKPQADDSQWVKCDSFEELTNKQILDNVPHKICVSTFVNNRVKTASLYDVSTRHLNSTAQVSKSSSCKITDSSFCSSSETEPICVNKNNATNEVFRTDSQKNNSKLKERILSYTSSKETVKSVQDMNLKSGNHFVPQNPNRHYFSNAPTYSRTATRIGVSSLNREQRLPLALFNENRKIVAAGSEPNLYNFVDDDIGKIEATDSEESSFRTLYVKNLNSRSEMCLNSIGQNLEAVRNAQFSVDTSNNDISKNIASDDVSIACENFDFPCIPPPPAYRNNAEDNADFGVSQNNNASSSAETVPQILCQVSANSVQDLSSTSENRKELRSSISLPPDVLDLHQLRQKSRDLDLPLISALCNDRSLLMLPKTVPTCSRQRHLGNKDYLRFCRSYGTAVSNCNTANFSSESVPYNGHRPVTWHVDSSKILSWPSNSNSLTDSSKNINTSACNGSAVKQALPPTILTSFGKTPEKSCGYERDNNYRLNKSQMIPTKLMSDHVSNGRLYLKGSSS